MRSRIGDDGQTAAHDYAAAFSIVQLTAAVVLCLIVFMRSPLFAFEIARVAVPITCAASVFTLTRLRLSVAGRSIAMILGLLLTSFAVSTFTMQWPSTANYSAQISGPQSYYQVGVMYQETLFREAKVFAEWAQLNLFGAATLAATAFFSANSVRLAQSNSTLVSDQAELGSIEL